MELIGCIVPGSDAMGTDLPHYLWLHLCEVASWSHVCPLVGKGRKGEMREK